tara:strand:- start:2937 stop:3314 length:378 start_codon:yes stop_codon:yes gene_type:complete
MKVNHLKEVIINKLKNMYTIKGRITNIEDLNINTAKGDFIKKLITIEETDSGFKHTMQFELFGQTSIDVIEHSQKLATEQYVDIDFYIKCREYKGRFYNTLMIKNCRIREQQTMESISNDNNTPF